MSLAVNALQKAIYRLLTAEGIKAYNHVPQGAPFPYVVIGEKTSVPSRTKADDGQDVTLTLHAWSHRAGDKECAELMARVYALLDRREPSLSLPGHHLAEITCEFTQLLPDSGDEAEPDHYYHGVMRFRALVADS